MLFNPDPDKPAQEVLFSRKKQNASSTNHEFQQQTGWKNVLSKTPCVLFDEKLNFKQNIDNVIPKINKGISVIKNSDILYHGNHYLLYIKLS